MPTKNPDGAERMRPDKRAVPWICSLLAVFSLVQPALLAENTSTLSLNQEAVKALNAGDTKSAIEKLEAALRADPNYRLARENLGIAHNNYALMIRKSDKQEALKHFHSALFYSPKNVTTRNNLETTIRTLGKDPDSFTDRVQLGDKAFSEKDFVGARVEYEAALALKEDEAVRTKLERLSNLVLPEGWPINPVVTHSEKQATEVKPEIDYGPYMVELQRRIKRAWHPTPDVDWGNEGSPTVVFKVHKDGSVSDLNLANSRGKVEASKSLMNAVRDAAPFSPLPTNAPESVDIQFTMNCCPVFSGSGSFRRF